MLPVNYEAGTEVEFSLDAGSDSLFLLETFPPVGGSQVRLCTLEVVEVTRIGVSFRSQSRTRWTLAFPASCMGFRQKTARKAPLIFSLRTGQ